MNHYLIEIRQANKLLAARQISADAGAYQRGQLVEALVASLPPYDVNAGALTAHEVYFAGDTGREIARYEVND